MNSLRNDLDFEDKNNKALASTLKLYVCASIFIVHYGLNKIQLAFGAQYTTVILTLLTY